MSPSRPERPEPRPSVPRTADPGTAEPPLRVLRVGSSPHPAPRGVEERTWESLDVHLPGALVDRPVEAARAGQAACDVGALALADAIVVRPPYATVPVCLACDAWAPDEPGLADHLRATGHPWRRPHEVAVRVLFETALREADPWRGRALVLEMDDDPAPGPGEQDLVELLARQATLVLARGASGAQAALRLGAPADRIVEAAGDAERLAALQAAVHAADPAGAARRRSLRQADAQVAAVIAERQARGLPAWDHDGEGVPLVSAVLPVVAESQALVERALASMLAAEGGRLEILVAGGPSSCAAVCAAAAGDPRVRHVAAPDAPDPSSPQGLADPAVTREAGRALALEAAFAVAAGAWIALLMPESVWVPEHPAALVELALEHGLDLLHGQTLLVAEGEVAGVLGSWPPSQTALAPDAAILSAALRVVRPDPGAAAAGETAAWNLWRRCLEAGARAANAEEPLALCDLAERPADLVALVGGGRP